MIYIYIYIYKINHLFGCATYIKRFMEKLNQFLPNLKFTYESSQRKVAFLDLNVSLENGCITTDLYTNNCTLKPQILES